MALNPTDPRLADYISAPHHGITIMYHVDEFYRVLADLQVPIIDEDTEILLYKIYCEGYDQGYHDGY